MRVYPMSDFSWRRRGKSPPIIHEKMAAQIKIRLMLPPRRTKYPIKCLSETPLLPLREFIWALGRLKNYDLVGSYRNEPNGGRDL
jgi:hypothetical protein